jgi:DNA polymerase III epsilon subunit-like protein
MKYELIFIDTETTGTGPDDKLIQVAYRTTDGIDVNELYNPNRKIDIGAMATHHITEKMIAGKPIFANSPVYQDLSDRFAKSQVFVAHNASFDVAMIEKEGLKVGPVIDTLKVARHLDPNSKIDSYALQYLRYLLGIEVDAVAHDAWGDILVLEQLFYRLVKKLMTEKNWSQEEAIEHMIKVSAEPMLYRTIPFGKYRGEKLEDIAKTDPGYLKWLLNQKENDPEGPDEDWIHSLKHYLHL